MIREFFRDRRGNYALLTAVAIVPIMGGLALAVDYTEMSKQRQETLNALDAAGIATARRIVEGATDDEAKAYARNFFETNLGSVDPSDTTLTVILPQNNAGGGTLKLTAALKYKPYFFPTFTSLIGKSSPDALDFSASSEIRLKNTLEVALVLDNSGSMDFLGGGSGKKRLDLLKGAAKELVDTLSNQASMMKQVSKPVQFGLVPFAASVNVGADKEDAAWMDRDGISPIHHENFNWTIMPSGYSVTQNASGIYTKAGNSWGTSKGLKVTRFTLFKEMKYYTNSSQTQKTNYTSWQGCVEARPSPYDIDDTLPSSATPATLFVPMFAPAETSGAYNRWLLYTDYWGNRYYWSDVSTSSSAAVRQAYMGKYFDIATGGYVGPYGTVPAGMDKGPNSMCTTTPITPLTDVGTTAGKTAVKTAIDAMVANGATNVPEGMAWGWRVLSSKAPFTEGRSETGKGNDKVVIVLTDGANTYYTPSSLGASDPANNKSIYSNLGYAGKWPTGYSTSRIFQGTPTSVSKTDYSNANYTKAMNAKFDTLCTNAKATNLVVMTVALDLNEKDVTEKAQIDALKACASESRFRKDSSGNPAKLFWNATGKSLSDDFKAIGDELSNLRIVG